MICCLNCSYKVEDESSFMEHVKVHQFEKGFRIPCKKGCPATFRNFKTERQHNSKACQSEDVKQKLETKRKRKNSEDTIESKHSKFGSNWSCPNCTEIINIANIPNFGDFKKIKDHCHIHAKNGEVACPVCDKKYEVIFNVAFL